MEQNLPGSKNRESFFLLGFPWKNICQRASNGDLRQVETAYYLGTQEMSIHRKCLADWQLLRLFSGRPRISGFGISTQLWKRRCWQQFVSSAKAADITHCFCTLRFLDSQNIIGRKSRRFYTAKKVPARGVKNFRLRSPSSEGK